MIMRMKVQHILEHESFYSVEPQLEVLAPQLKSSEHESL